MNYDFSEELEEILFDITDGSPSKKRLGQLARRGMKSEQETCSSCRYFCLQYCDMWKTDTMSVNDYCSRWTNT